MNLCTLHLIVEFGFLQREEIRTPKCTLAPILIFIDSQDICECITCMMRNLFVILYIQKLVFLVVKNEPVAYTACT